MLRFSSEQEALQHLANITGKQVRVAKETDPELVELIKKEWIEANFSGDELERLAKKEIKDLAEKNVFTVKDFEEYCERIEAQEDEKEERKGWYDDGQPK